MRIFSYQGFTSKELIMVLAVITIMCVAAIPPFFALQKSKRRSDMEKTVMELNAKLATLKSEKKPFPMIADANPIQSPCLTCFENLLEEKIANPLWFKFADNVYLFSVSGKIGAAADYQSEGDFKIEYASDAGEIRVEEIMPVQ